MKKPEAQYKNTPLIDTCISTIVSVIVLQLQEQVTMAHITSLLLTVLGVVLLCSHCSSFEIKSLVHKVVPPSVQCFFRSKEGDYAKHHCKNKQPETTQQEEHGSLDFFGRTIIRKIAKKFSSDDEEKPVEVSSATKGLDCDRSFFGGVADAFKRKVRAIYPGTNWCGGGNVSESGDDLGKYYLTDSCCREHDLCSDNIESDRTKYGLKNTGLFVRSHCDCERRFYRCLRYADTFVSRSIGFTYFTVLGPQCFQQEHKIVSCLQTEKGKCIRYKFDMQSEKTYQWFDSPTF